MSKKTPFLDKDESFFDDTDRKRYNASNLFGYDDEEFEEDLDEAEENSEAATSGLDTNVEAYPDKDTGDDTGEDVYRVLGKDNGKSLF